MIYREDISISHEEADCIIVQQAMMVSEYEQLTNFMVMESPIHGRSVIDICRTVKNEEQIAHDLHACHALSGSGTVACYFGIGKVKALKL